MSKVSHYYLELCLGKIRGCNKLDKMQNNTFLSKCHCVKSVGIRSFSGPYIPAFRLNTDDILCITPYSGRIRENTDQKNSKYGHFYAVNISKLYNSTYQFEFVLNFRKYLGKLQISLNRKNSTVTSDK